jgi:hypothetical protein
MPIPEVRAMVALPAIAIEVAPGVGGLRGGDANKQRDRREGAKNEFHRVPPLVIDAKETTRLSQTIPLIPNRQIRLI